MVRVAVECLVRRSDGIYTAWISYCEDDVLGTAVYLCDLIKVFSPCSERKDVLGSVLLSLPLLLRFTARRNFVS